MSPLLKVSAPTQIRSHKLKVVASRSQLAGTADSRALTTPLTAIAGGSTDGRHLRRPGVSLRSESRPEISVNLVLRRARRSAREGSRQLRLASVIGAERSTPGRVASRGFSPPGTHHGRRLRQYRHQGSSRSYHPRKAIWNAYCLLTKLHAASESLMDHAIGHASDCVRRLNPVPRVRLQRA